MKNVARVCVLFLMLAGTLTAEEPSSVTLVKDGKPLLPVYAGSVVPAVDELCHYLQEISGAKFAPAKAQRGSSGIYVGLIADFPWVPVENVKELGAEGFILRSDDKNLFLLAAEAPGAQHAVTTFLHGLGCRWFFPGKTWEVIPKRATISGTWNERQSPSFATQRLISYGFGAYRPCKNDYVQWNRHNRMGGPIEVSIGHTWCGLNREKDFKEHPEWFALVNGKRQPSKPCYSHPEVIQHATAYALKKAAAGQQMISTTPPDGLGYCECERCLAVFQGGNAKKMHGSTFATRPDGVVVNVTSETLFWMVNEVAQAVSKKYPKTLVGCYAYSAYSHPPSFKLHPNVFLQTTTAYRRTPLSLEEQLQAFGERAGQVGIREYYSVYQWDWDSPYPTQVTPAKLEKSLQFFHKNHVTSVNAEASNNWAPRGLGYYVASQLLWNVDADVPAILRDFYEQAFGPAARPMERYYARWYGPSVQVFDAAPDGEVDNSKKSTTVRLDDLRAAFRDLDEAARLVKDLPGPRERVDDLRMYVHYLLLRHGVEQAEKSGDEPAILAAIMAETVFGGRLTTTNMIHSRPLLGKAFLRRFKKDKALLASIPEAQQPDRGWRVVGTPPHRAELERLWAEDIAAFKIR